MPESIAEEKKILRRRVRESIAALSEGERLLFSRAACAVLAETEAFIKASTVLAYRPIRGECSPEGIVERARAQGKRTVFPLCMDGNRLALYAASADEDFCTGAYGIPEPDPERCELIAPEEIDLAVIPGMAFDRECRRMGRGAGYYDRLLERFAGVKAGFAYSIQVYDAIPADEHDISMDFIVTNNGIIVNKT